MMRAFLSVATESATWREDLNVRTHYSHTRSVTNLLAQMCRNRSYRNVGN